MGIAFSSPAKLDCDAQQIDAYDLADARFERMVSMSIQRRTSSWCRLCVSDTCQIGQSELPSQLDEKCSNDAKESKYTEEINDQLEIVRQKRQNIMSFLERTKNKNATNLTPESHDSQHDTQYSAASVFVDIMNNNNGVLVLPLTPLFSTSPDLFEEIHGLVTGLPVVVGANILKEYTLASQSPHRIRLSLITPRCTYKSCKNPSKLNTLCHALTLRFCVLEEAEIDDESIQNKSLFDTKRKPHDKIACKDNANKTSLTKMFVNDSDNGSNLGSTDHESDIYDSSKQYAVIFYCHNASLDENGHGCFRIKGDLFPKEITDNEHTNKMPFVAGSQHPFQLIIFCDPKSPNGLSGTYMRKMETSEFNLRWKFNVKLHV